MANKFVIEVRAKGFTNLEQQLQRADKATRGYEKSNQKLRGTTSGLRRQIGALRNNVLLYTFAVGAAVKAVGTLVGASAKFEAVRTRLVGLTGSVDKANKAFDTFNAVAATTPFSLEDVVNAGAQLKAFGADAEALIKPITDLAAFMGTTATEAANSFGRAFAGGAGAADILRERGILNIIKSSQGIADLSKTTLPQFREALISAIQDPVVGIEGSTDRLSKTTTGAISNMGDSYTRLAAVIGDRLKPVTDATIKSLTNLAEGTRKAIEGDTRSEVQKLTDRFVENERQLEINAIASNKVGKEVQNVADIFSVAEAKSRALTFAYGDMSDKSLEYQAMVIKENSAQVTQTNLLTQNREALEEQQIALIQQIDTLGGLGAVNQEVVLSYQKMVDAIEFVATTQHLHLETLQEIKELKPIDPINSALKALDPQQQAAIGMTRRLSDTFIQAGINGQNMGQAVITSLKSIAAEIISQAVVFGMLKTFFAPQSMGFGLADFIFKGFGVGHQGGSVQKFAGGGVVHGRDNVPILAQAGEFIIKRDSAQSIGLDALTQMNESGQAASNINVHIHGGVVQEDYIRNELIPAINRSGARIA